MAAGVHAQAEQEQQSQQQAAAQAEEEEESRSKAPLDTGRFSEEAHDEGSLDGTPVVGGGEESVRASEETARHEDEE